MARLLNGVVLGVFAAVAVAGCAHHSVPAADAGGDFADPEEGVWNALSMKMMVGADPAGASEKKRLEIVVSNPTAHPLSFKVFDGSVPEGFGLRLVEAPQTGLACTSGSEPPHETVTLEPRALRTFHVFGADDWFLYAADTATPFKPEGKTWHLRAMWGNHTSDAVALKLD